MPTFGSLPLVTPRLTLRPLVEADAPAFFAIYSHPEVMRFWSSPPLTDVAQARKSVLAIEEGYRCGDFLQLGLERQRDAALIGTCTIFSFHAASRRAEMGYALGRPYWGAGYMHEALTALVHYAFGELNLHRLEADIDPRNRASARTLERLGFQQEGLLRERWIVGDEISDTAWYGLLCWEWQNNLQITRG
ncbi:GNAT family N-acetyltransferase [Caldilinea sp.]|uniref:GNAT family N-acetyltransferase n=1 Tax=Caldilinea sp. TaxID=2293560 RepID=UPI002C6BA6B9|nr:GNAT family N-acetyltransferase [Caldilinea sp.]